MLSEQESIFKLQEFIPKQVEILSEEQEEPITFDKVSAVLIAKNKIWSKNITLEILDHYVGLLFFEKDNVCYISIRKISDINQEVFTIKLINDECFLNFWKTISIS
jgi:hypothetical protein